MTFHEGRFTCNLLPKAGSADNGTKIDIIINRNKYSISAMCKMLNVARRLIYYKRKVRKTDSVLKNKIIQIFRKSRNNYGTRKTKKNITASGRKTASIMKKYCPVSNYTIKQYKVHVKQTNRDTVPNVINREFKNRKDLEVVVSDLTYVKVNRKWNYVCLLINLFNREIISYSIGANKTADLVMKAWNKCNVDVKTINIFHTDRGVNLKIKREEVFGRESDRELPKQPRLSL